MKVIFIDRNIVAMMKYYNDTKKVLPEYSRQYAKIRKYDRHHHLVSLLLSSTEGTRQGLQTGAQMKETIEEDSEIVKNFLGDARNDGDVLANIVVGDAAIFAEDLLARCMSYLSWAAPHIKKPLKLKETSAPKNLLINKAIQDGISPTHPVVLSCLAVLYGNTKAKDMIRGSGTWAGFSDYNAVSDIMILSRLGLIKALDNDRYAWSSINPIFITRDEGLEEFLDSFIITRARSLEIVAQNRYRTLTTLLPKRKLFPTLSREGFAALVLALQGRQTLME